MAAREAWPTGIWRWLIKQCSKKKYRWTANRGITYRHNQEIKNTWEKAEASTPSKVKISCPVSGSVSSTGVDTISVHPSTALSIQPSVSFHPIVSWGDWTIGTTSGGSLALGLEFGFGQCRATRGEWREGEYILSASGGLGLAVAFPQRLQFFSRWSPAQISLFPGSSNPPLLSPKDEGWQQHAATRPLKVSLCVAQFFVNVSFKLSLTYPPWEHYAFPAISNYITVQLLKIKEKENF